MDCEGKPMWFGRSVPSTPSTNHVWLTTRIESAFDNNSIRSFIDKKLCACALFSTDISPNWFRWPHLVGLCPILEAFPPFDLDALARSLASAVEALTPNFSVRRPLSITSCTRFWQPITRTCKQVTQMNRVRSLEKVNLKLHIFGKDTKFN